jgi:hypothetical protein
VPGSGRVRGARRPRTRGRGLCARKARPGSGVVVFVAGEADDWRAAPAVPCVGGSMVRIVEFLRRTLDRARRLAGRAPTEQRGLAAEGEAWKYRQGPAGGGGLGGPFGR